MDLDFDSSEAAILDHRQQQLHKMKRSYSLPKDLDSSTSGCGEDSGVNSGIILDERDKSEVIKVASQVVARSNGAYAVHSTADDEDGVVQGAADED